MRDVGSSKCAVPARLSRAALRALDDAAAGGGHSRVGSVVTPKILRRPVGCVEHADVPSPASVTRGLKRGAPEEDFPVTSAWRHNAVRDQRRKKSKPGPSRGRLQSIERDLPIYGAVPVAHTDRSAVVLQHQSERAARIRLLARSHIWLHSPELVKRDGRTDNFNGKYKCTKCDARFISEVRAARGDYVCGAARGCEHPCRADREALVKSFCLTAGVHPSIQDSQLQSYAPRRSVFASWKCPACRWTMPANVARPSVQRLQHLKINGLEQLRSSMPKSVKKRLCQEANTASQVSRLALSNRRWELWKSTRPACAHHCMERPDPKSTCGACGKQMCLTSAHRNPCPRALGYVSQYDPDYVANYARFFRELREGWQTVIATVRMEVADAATKRARFKARTSY